MRPTYAFIWRATLLSTLTASLGACSSSQFHQSEKRASARRESGEGAALGKDPGDCLKVQRGHDHPGQYPGQGPGPGPGHDPGHDPDHGDDFEDDPKGDEPLPPPPSGKQPCGDVYRPIDQDDDYVPPPYPSQTPIDPGQCGKNGKYCDDGGPGQWPGQTCQGKRYQKNDVEACLDAFRASGYDTQGQWAIDVHELSAVSLFEDSVLQDAGQEPKIVIIEALSLLGSMRFELVNPNALYCIKSRALLEEIHVTSCHGANVVFGDDSNFLSQVSGAVVDCR